MLTMEEAIHMWRQGLGVYAKSLYILLNFAVNFKIL